MDSDRDRTLAARTLDDVINTDAARLLSPWPDNRFTVQSVISFLLLDGICFRDRLSSFGIGYRLPAQNLVLTHAPQFWNKLVYSEISA